MTWTNIHPMRPKARRRIPSATGRRVLTGKSLPRGVPRRARTADGKREQEAVLFGNLEGGFLLAPPDLPFARRGPLFLGDVLVGLDDRLLDLFHPVPDGVVVALLARLLPVGAGLLVREPFLAVRVQRQERIHRGPTPRGAAADDG